MQRKFSLSVYEINLIIAMTTMMLNQHTQKKYNHVIVFFSVEKMRKGKRKNERETLAKYSGERYSVTRNVARRKEQVSSN